MTVLICSLTDLEDSLAGETPFYAPHMIENKSILSPEVLCFGQLLFEMATGCDRAPEQRLSSVKDKIPQELYALLEVIFDCRDPQNPPSLKALLKHAFFADTQLQVKIHKSVLVEEWDEKVRSSLKSFRHMTPKAINPSASLTLKRTPSAANVDSIAARKGSAGMVSSSSGGSISVTSPRAKSPPPPTRAQSPPPPRTKTSATSSAPGSGAPAPPPPPRMLLRTLPFHAKGLTHFLLSSLDEQQRGFECSSRTARRSWSSSGLSAKRQPLGQTKEGAEEVITKMVWSENSFPRQFGHGAIFFTGIAQIKT